MSNKLHIALLTAIVLATLTAGGVWYYKKDQAAAQLERVHKAEVKDALTEHERQAAEGEVNRVDEALKKPAAPLSEAALWEKLKREGKLKD